MNRKNAAVIFALFVFVLVFSMFFGSKEGFDLNIFLELRVARVLLAASVGAALAVAGVLLQALFSNPLCDPYTLGISSGATLGTVIFHSLQMTCFGIGAAGGALTGSLASTLGLMAVAKTLRVRTEGVLLIGVMMSFFGASLVSVWMAFTDANGIQGAIGWLLGDLSKAQFNLSVVMLFAVTLLILLASRYSKELDLLLLGEEDARSLGLSYEKVRWVVLILASLLISASVSTAGMVGFVGLVVPHFVRLWLGIRHRTLILYSALVGAIFVVISDLLAKQLIRPYEMPVGVITSLVGAPVFVWFLFRKGARVVR